MKSPIRWKFILLLSAFLVALAVMRWESSSHAQAGEALATERVWSDGFFVSAALFASIGILSLVSSWGGFDTLSYGASFLAARFTRRDSEYKSYFDYVRAKGAEREERKARRNARGGLHALDFMITGMLMLALSIVAMLAQ
ncbi:MAG: DUF3899 domain-containing protein [Treponema sp.]|nr:DUF3899 domain-containing protein [Treponema sp.]